MQDSAAADQRLAALTESMLQHSSDALQQEDSAVDLRTYARGRIQYGSSELACMKFKEDIKTLAPETSLGTGQFSLQLPYREVFLPTLTTI